MRTWIATLAFFCVAFLGTARAFAAAIDCGNSIVLSQNYPPTPSAPLCTPLGDGSVDLYMLCINSDDGSRCAVYWTEYYDMEYQLVQGQCNLTGGSWSYNNITSDSCGD